MTCQLSDIIVLGGGITGCCLAYELKKKSFSVTLLEKETIGAAASGRNGGGVRQQNRVPEELPLAMVAVKVWREITESLSIDVEYRQTGNLMLILSEDEIERYREAVERQRRAGLMVDFLDEKQVRELVPALSDKIEIPGGTYCSSDGSANPLLMTKALAAKARELGVNIHEHEPVISVGEKKGKGSAHMMCVKTSKGSYESPIVINAAGVGAGNICKMLGFDLPCEIKRSQILVTKAVPPVIKPFVADPRGYMRQVLNGNFHLGVNSQPVSGCDTRTGLSVFGDATKHYMTLFPFMEHLPIIRTWAGLTYWTPDAFPVIGKAPGWENVYLATGFSGHGFCLGLGAARVLSQIIAGEEAAVDMKCFSWSRFSSGKLGLDHNPDHLEEGVK